jgi:hypothetical protein
MTRVFCAAVISVALCSASFARQSHDWADVEKLKPGAKIVVTFWADNPVAGRFESASSSGLRMTIGSKRRGAVVKQFAREDVWTVTHIAGPRLGEPDVWILNGALIGGAAGLTLGVVRDAKREPGAGANWLLDGVAGAGLGFFGGCAAAAGKGIVGLFRHDQLVYRDPRAASSFPELHSQVFEDGR